MTTVRDAITAWKAAPVPLRLACGVQHYEWGERGPSALIPNLLGQPASDPALPFAELWIGGHPALPASVALDGARVTLTELIAEAPQEALGAAALGLFGSQLPFLAKVLTAERPLSIQAHPNRAQAEAGFAREEAAGIPRGAPERNYRDPNHKPELIVALGDFFALEGFRPIPQIAAAFGAVPELGPLVAPPPAHGAERAWLRELFERCMSPDDDAAGRALATLVTRLDRAAPAPGAPAAPATRDQREYWLVGTARRLPQSPRPDRGLFGFYLLNLVHLRAGEALFLSAGEPHAYLEGRGLEVMANSDNVLRGGLTPKHVDVPELLRVLSFDAAPARVLRPDSTGAYPTAVGEFAARLIVLSPADAPRALPASSAMVLLGVEGDATLEAGTHPLALARGQAWFVPAAMGGCRVAAATGSPRTQVFAVNVPAPA